MVADFMTVFFGRTVQFNPDIFQLRQSDRFAVYQPNRAPLIVRRLGLFIMMLALELRKAYGWIAEEVPISRLHISLDIGQSHTIHVFKPCAFFFEIGRKQIFRLLPCCFVALSFLHPSSIAW